MNGAVVPGPGSASSYAESGLLPLRALLVSDDVNEVVVNPDGRVFVEWVSKPTMEQHVAVKLTARAIENLATQLAGETGNQLGEQKPLVSGRFMAFGQSVRVQIVVPPALEAGVSLSLRKYVSRALDLGEIGLLGASLQEIDRERQGRLQGLRQLLEKGAVKELFKAAIDDRMNILISGGTSSGKTTLARALLGLSDKAERIVTIEDAAELHLPHGNQVAMIAERQEKSPRSPAVLLESALRMRPDRLILGEIRGQEALNLLEAINTGHPGSLTTIHADSPGLALERLALMVMRSGVRLTRQDVIEYALKTIDMIVQVGRGGGRRGIMEIRLTARSASESAATGGFEGGSAPFPN